MIIIIKLVNLKKNIDTDNINLNINQLNLYKNNLAAIAGSSDSGKDLLLQILAGVTSQDSGEYYLNNINTGLFTYQKWTKFRKNYIGIIFDNDLFENNTVKENIYFFKKMNNQREAQNKFNNIVNKLNLSKIINQQCFRLTYFEKLLVNLARMIFFDYEIILINIFTENLSENEIKQFITYLNMFKNNRLIVFTIELNLLNFDDNINKIFFLEKGKIVNIIEKSEEKPKENLIENKNKKVINNKININNISWLIIKKSYWQIIGLIIIISISITILGLFLDFNKKENENIYNKVTDSISANSISASYVNFSETNKTINKEYVRFTENNVNDLMDTIDYLPYYFNYNPIFYSSFLKSSYLIENEEIVIDGSYFVPIGNDLFIDNKKHLIKNGREPNSESFNEIIVTTGFLRNFSNLNVNESIDIKIDYKLDINMIEYHFLYEKQLKIIDTIEDNDLISIYYNINAFDIDVKQVKSKNISIIDALTNKCEDSTECLRGIIIFPENSNDIKNIYEILLKKGNVILDLTKPITKNDIKRFLTKNEGFEIDNKSLYLYRIEQNFLSFYSFFSLFFIFILFIFIYFLLRVYLYSFIIIHQNKFKTAINYGISLYDLKRIFINLGLFIGTISFVFAFIILMILKLSNYTFFNNIFQSNDSNNYFKNILPDTVFNISNILMVNDLYIYLFLLFISLLITVLAYWLSFFRNKNQMSKYKE